MCRRRRRRSNIAGPTIEYEDPSNLTKAKRTASTIVVFKLICVELHGLSCVVSDWLQYVYRCPKQTLIRKLRKKKIYVRYAML